MDPSSLKFTFVGDGGVGKTALIKAFAENEFSDKDILPTVLVLIIIFLSRIHCLM